MAPGRDISVSEFASLFPITSDTSVLPAADLVIAPSATITDANSTNLVFAYGDADECR
jgi:hypothetical protein